jgi:hypothetical protein
LRQDLEEEFTENHFAISGYKPLTRITNLGWQKAQTKSFCPLTLCPLSSPTLGVTTQALTGHFGQHMKFSVERPRIDWAFASSQRKHLDHATCHPLRSFPARPDPVSARRASGLGFVAQPSNLDGFVVNRRKPLGLCTTFTPIPLMTWPPRHPVSVWFFGLNQPNPPCRLWL